MAGLLAGGMIEKLLGDRLEAALSQYVTRVDKEKLNLSKGDLNLAKLTLKPRDIPGAGFHVKGGFIQSLQIKVPWKALKKKSVEVQVDGVLIVIRPRAVTEADRLDLRKQALAGKSQKLADDEKTGEEKGFMKRFVESIMDNLVVTVRNVTVVMEFDDWTQANGAVVPPQFRLRATLRELQFQTCGADWKPAFVKMTKDQDIVHKVCDATGLGLRVSNEPPNKNLAVFEHANADPNAYGAPVLDPTSIQLRLRMRKSSEPDTTMPKFVGQLLSEIVNLSLSQFQYQCLTAVSFAEPWKPDLRRERALIPSPTQRPQKAHTAQFWWRYAVDAVCHHVAASRRSGKGSRISWSYFCDLVLYRSRYIRTYKQKLREQTVDSADAAYSAEVEQSLLVEDVLFFRKLAKYEKDAEDGVLDAPSKAKSAADEACKQKVKKEKVAAPAGENKSRFGGFKAKAQAKLKEAQAIAEAKLAELNQVEEEVLEPDAYPPLFWLAESDVGGVVAGIGIADLKVGSRYYAEGGVRAVKRSAEDVQVTRAKESQSMAAVATAAMDAAKLLTTSSETSEESPRSSAGVGGGGPLSREGRILLYRRLGFFSEDGENEVLMDSKVDPQYVHIGMQIDVGKINIALTAPKPGGDVHSQTSFSMVEISKTSVRVSKRPRSIKVEGNVYAADLAARSVSGSGEITSLLGLQRPEGGQGALMNFAMDTLLDPRKDPNTSAKVAMTVAGLTLRVMPEIIHEHITFFKPASAATSSAHDGIHSHVLKVEKVKVQSTSKVALTVTLLHTVIDLPEHADFGGCFSLAIRKFCAESTSEAAATRAGEFNTVCDSVEDVVAASAHAVHVVRQQHAGCQDLAITIENVEMSHSYPLDDSVAADYVMRPFSCTAGITVAKNLVAGMPSYVAITAAVPTVYIDVPVNIAARLVVLTKHILEILVPPPVVPVREAVPAPVLQGDREIELPAGSMLKLSLWVVCDGLEVLMAAPENSSDVAGLQFVVTKTSVGFLSLSDEVKFVCAQTSELSLSWTRTSDSSRTDPILSLKQPTGSPALDFQLLARNPPKGNNHLEQLISLEVAQVGVTANPKFVGCIQGYIAGFTDVLNHEPSAAANQVVLTPKPTVIKPAKRALLKLEMVDLSLNCQIDAQTDSQQGSMNILGTKSMLEVAAEPMTAETNMSFGLAIGNIALTMKQDGSDLSLVDQQDGALDDSPVVNLHFERATLPRGSSAVPSPALLNVDIRTVSIWIYPSLLRLFYELQASIKALNARRSTKSQKQISTDVAEKSPAAPPMALNIEGSVSNCGVLLSVVDPSQCGSENSSLVVGVQVGAAMIPESAPGANDSTRTTNLSVEQLSAYTARLDKDGMVTRKTPLVHDFDVNVYFAEMADGIEIDVKCSQIIARITAKEATALLALRGLAKLKPKPANAPPSSPRSLPLTDQSPTAHLSEDESEDEFDGGTEPAPEMMMGKSEAVDVPPKTRKITRGSFDIAWVRMAMADTEDVAAVLIGHCVANFTDVSGNIFIENMAISDCRAGDTGMLVLGMGEWIDFTEEPKNTAANTAEPAAEVDEMDATVQFQWDLILTSPTADDLSFETSADITEKLHIELELAPVQLRATPRFAASCINWAASVWADRDVEDDEVDAAEDATALAKDTDWVLHSDYCTEETHELSQLNRRLFVEKPAHGKHSTVVFSGGKLVGRSKRPLLYVADGVHLFLQDVDVNELDDSAIMLGVGSQVSGSINLDGSEVFWDGALSNSFRERRRQNKVARQRNIDATIIIPEIRCTSFHAHGNICFVFGISSKYLVTGLHRRLTAEVSNIDLSCRGTDEISTSLLFIDSVTVSYDTTSSNLGTGAVQVHLGRIPVVMSNSIGQAVMWALSEWQVIVQKAGVLAAEFRKAEPPELRRQRIEMERKKRQEASMTTFVANLQCKEIQMLILNDTSSERNGGKQLAVRLSINSISMESTRILVPADDEDDEDSTEQQNHVYFDVCADVMNPNLAVWEPLLEPCGIDTTAVKESLTSMSIDVRVGKAVSTITSFTEEARTGSLEFNISASMLDMFRHTADCWVRSLATRKKSESVAAYPTDMLARVGHGDDGELCSDLMLFNDLPDITLEYTCGEAFAHKGVCSGLVHGESELLKLKYAGDESARYLEIWMNGYRPLRMQVEKVMSEVKNFQPIEDGPRISMVSVVEFIGSQKTISIRSLVFVRNMTDRVVEVETQGAATEMTILEPGKGLSLPSIATSVRIRPEEGFEWSPPLWRKTYAVHGEVTLADCKSTQNAESEPCHYWVRNTYAQEVSGQKNALTLAVYAPVALTNLLPLDLEYKVYSSATAKKPRHEGSLTSGETLLLHTIPSEAWIKFHTDGFRWSKLYKVTERLETATIEMPDAANRLCFMQMQVEETEDAGRQVTIWCPFWLVNYTGLRLCYAADDALAYNAVAGPDASESPQPFLVSQKKVAVKAVQKGPGYIGVIEGNYDTAWSKAFSVTTIGTSGVFSLVDKTNNSWRFDIATEIHLGAGAYRRTKVVTLRPQFTVVNRLEEVLAARQLEAVTELAIQINPGESHPLYWPHSQTQFKHVVHRTVQDGTWSWSEPIDVVGSNTNALTIHRADGISGPDHRFALKKCAVRASPDDASGKAGSKSAGEVLSVLESHAGADGKSWVRCPKGWICESAPDGGAQLGQIDAIAAIGDGTISGYLEKMGEVNTSYKKRWFALDWPELAYFETQGGTKKGCVDMRACSAVEPGAGTKKSEKNVILLHTDVGRIYNLRAPSDEMWEKWLNAMRTAMLARTGGELNIRAELQLTGSRSNIVVSVAKPLEPQYMIQNHTTQVTATISQKDVPNIEVVVDPHQSAPWEYPKPVQVQRAILRLESVTSRDEPTVKEYSLDEIKEHKKLVVGDTEIVVTVKVKGLTKVCHINSAKKMKRTKSGLQRGSSADSPIQGPNARQRRLSVELLEEPEAAAESKRQIQLKLQIDQMGFALIGARPDSRLGLLNDVLYLGVTDLTLDLSQSKDGEHTIVLTVDRSATTLPSLPLTRLGSSHCDLVRPGSEHNSIVIGSRFQIDNGNRTTPYPVVFRIIQTEQSIGKPLLQFSAIKCGKEMGANSYRMIQLLLLEADVVVDEELVAAVFMFGGSLRWKKNRSNTLGMDDLVLSVGGNDAGVKLIAAQSFFCEFLQIHPIKMAITYASSAGISMMESLGSNPLLDLLANVDHAPLKLNALLLQDLVTSQDQLVERIVKHYKRQGLTEMYKLMGTADLLGNPIGLVSGMGQGVFDFFYEPGSALFTNPADFGKGLSKGASSLLKGVAGGSMNTVGKMTGAVGKGLTSLTMDDGYMTERRAETSAEDAYDGVMKGVEHLGSGIMKGMTGIVMNPYKESKKDGAKGFMRGMGKGLIGAVVKPTTGVLDLATDISTGIKKEVYGDLKAVRMRPPRAPVYDPGAPLAAYDVHRAMAADLVISTSLHKTLKNILKEQMAYYVRVSGGTRIIIVTNERVLEIVSAPGTPEGFTTNLTLVSDIHKLQQNTETSIEITLGKGTSKKDKDKKKILEVESSDSASDITTFLFQAVAGGGGGH